MSYTEDQVIARVATVLQDAAATATWATAEIRQAIDEGLIEIAQYRPYITLATATTTEGTRSVDVSSVTGHLWIDEVEFRVDKSEKRWRNFRELEAGRIELEIDFSPSAGEAVRLYVAGPHVLDGTVTNTLDPREEQILINWSAGKSAQNKAMFLYLQGSLAVTDVAMAATAIASMSALVSSATAFLASAATSVALSPALILEAATAVDNATAQMGSATARLAAGATLINTITVGPSPETHYANYAQVDLSNANSRLNEAVNHLSQAARDESIAGTYSGLAGRELSVAETHLNQARGDMNKISSRLSIASAGQHLERWGQMKQAQAEQDLKARVRVKPYRRYPTVA